MQKRRMKPTKKRTPPGSAPHKWAGGLDKILVGFIRLFCMVYYADRYRIFFGPKPLYLFKCQLRACVNYRLVIRHYRPSGGCYLVSLGVYPLDSLCNKFYAFFFQTGF